MAAEWKSLRLGDVIDIKHGFAFPGDGITDEPSHNILMTPGNFEIGGGFKAEKFKYFVGDVPAEYVLTTGDLVVTMTDLSKQADTLGYPALVPALPGKTFLHNQRIGKVVILDERRVDKTFLSYLLRSPSYRAEVLAGATGTTVKHTSPSRIRAFETTIPEKPEQLRIAAVLSALDEKIELLRRISGTLEAMARALFRSWFVDFDPVRAKCGEYRHDVPKQIADLFPSAFVDRRGSNVPEGWSLGTIEDVAEEQRRSVSADEIEPMTPYIGLEHMPRRSIALSDWGRAEGLESSKLRFQTGEILFGKLRPYFHKVGVAPVNGVCSTDIVVVGARSQSWRGFVLGHLSSDEFVQAVNAAATGTKMPRTNWGEMERYPVALPPPILAQAFDDLVQPEVEKIISNIHEARVLAGLRDRLLPALISGELRVPDLESFADSVPNGKH